MSHTPKGIVDNLRTLLEQAKELEKPVLVGYVNEARKGRWATLYGSDDPQDLLGWIYTLVAAYAMRSKCGHMDCAIADVLRFIDDNRNTPQRVVKE